MNPPSRHRAHLAAILAAAALVAAPVRAGWLVDVDAGAFHNSNLTRAQDRVDRRPDAALALAVSAGRYFALSGYDGVTLAGNLRGERFHRYRGLDLVAVGLSGSWRRKLGLGLTAPYLQVSTAAASEAYGDDVRDGERLDLRVELGRRFDEALAAGVGAFHDRRFGESDVPIVPGVSGAIFDLRGYGAFAFADYALDERWLFGGRVSVRRGDVESTSQRSKAVFRASTAIADDPAFRDPDLFGYRLRGTTWSAGATLSYALGDRGSLNLGYLDERTDAAQGLEYRSRIVNATFAWRFP